MIRRLRAKGLIVIRSVKTLQKRKKGAVPSFALLPTTLTIDPAIPDGQQKSVEARPDLPAPTKALIVALVQALMLIHSMRSDMPTTTTTSNRGQKNRWEFFQKLGWEGSVVPTKVSPVESLVGDIPRSANKFKTLRNPGICFIGGEPARICEYVAVFPHHPQSKADTFHAPRWRGFW